MFFTKRSQNGAQIELTKGFDPVQKAQPSAGLFVSVLENSPKSPVMLRQRSRGFWGSMITRERKLLGMCVEIIAEAGKHIFYCTIAIELGTGDAGREKIYPACLWTIDPYRQTVVRCN